MLRKRRYILAAAIILLLTLFGVLLYDVLRGVGTSPDANGTIFVMREGGAYVQNTVQ